MFHNHNKLSSINDKLCNFSSQAQHRYHICREHDRATLLPNIASIFFYLFSLHFSSRHIILKEFLFSDSQFMAEANDLHCLLLSCLWQSSLKIGLVFSEVSVKNWNSCARLTKHSFVHWLARNSLWQRVQGFQLKVKSAIRVSLQYGAFISNICSISQLI